jgi:hypothetical protein
MAQKSKKPARSPSLRIVSLAGVLCIIFILFSKSSRYPKPEVVTKVNEPIGKVDRKPFYENFTVFVEDVISNLRNAPVLENDKHALHVAFPRASMNGLWLEFGVFSGQTIRMMADAYRGPGAVYGFDSFEGLPETWRTVMVKGFFDMKAQPPFEETEQIKWVKGWYDQSIPRFVRDVAPEKISFIHVDCDLYSSTSAIFKGLDKWLEPGVVIVFDELMNYPGYQEHEIKALFELLQDRPDLGFRIIGTSTRNVPLDVQQEILDQGAAIQLCANGNKDCSLSDGFA